MNKHVRGPEHKIYIIAKIKPSGISCFVTSAGHAINNFGGKCSTFSPVQPTNRLPFLQAGSCFDCMWQIYFANRSQPQGYPPAAKPRGLSMLWPIFKPVLGPKEHAGCSWCPHLHRRAWPEKNSPASMPKTLISYTKAKLALRVC